MSAVQAADGAAASPPARPAVPAARPTAFAPLQGGERALGTLVLSLATFMTVLDTSIANVSIPAISGDLGVSPNQGTWVITSFAVANAISVPLTGWLTQRFGQVRLFAGSGGYGDGEQRRDFVSVEDCIKVNLHFLDNPELSGIFNVGTGRAQSFNDVAIATINTCRRASGLEHLGLDAARAQGLIEYAPFPEALKGKYQNFTQADVGALRGAGYAEPFLTVEDGVERYCRYLLEESSPRGD